MAQWWHEHLLLQITQVWFLAHTSGALQLPITSVPGATGLRCTHKYISYPTKQSPHISKLAVVVHVWNPSTWEGETERSGVQDYPSLCRRLEDSKDYTRLCLEDPPQQHHISGIYSPRHKGRSLHLPLSVLTAGRWHWRTYCWRWHRRTVGKGRGWARAARVGSCHEQYATWLAFNSFCFPAQKHSQFRG